MIRALVLCCAAWLAGCAAQPPPPAVLTLTIEAGKDQNPDQAGQASPVAIHIYLLTSSARFERAEVFALLERERETLGDELSASETIVLAPGESKSVTRVLKPGVQAVGIAVVFREIDRASWRATAPVAASGPSAFRLRTEGVAVRLVPAKAP